MHRMAKTALSGCIGLVAAGICTASCWAATVTMTSGGKLRGDIERQEEDQIYMRINIGTVGFPMNRIESIDATPEEMRRVYEAALAKLPQKDALARFNLGVFCELGKLFAEAERMYKEAGELDPGIAGLKERIEKVKVETVQAEKEKLDKLEKARTELAQADKLAAGGKGREAIEAYRSVLAAAPELAGETKPKLLVLCISEGDGALKGKNRELAVELFEEALSLDPENKELKKKYDDLCLDYGKSLMEETERERALSYFMRVKERSLEILNGLWAKETSLTDYLDMLLRGELAGPPPESQMLLSLEDSGLTDRQAALRYCLDGLGVGTTTFAVENLKAQQTGGAAPAPGRPPASPAPRPTQPPPPRSLPPELLGGPVPPGLTKEEYQKYRKTIQERSAPRPPGPRPAPTPPPAAAPRGPLTYAVSGKLTNRGSVSAYHVVLEIGAEQLWLGTIAPGEGADFQSSGAAPKPSLVHYTTQLGVRKSVGL